MDCPGDQPDQKQAFALCFYGTNIAPAAWAAIRQLVKSVIFVIDLNWAYSSIKMSLWKYKVHRCECAYFSCSQFLYTFDKNNWTKWIKHLQVVRFIIFSVRLKFRQSRLLCPTTQRFAARYWKCHEKLARWSSNVVLVIQADSATMWGKGMK